MLNFVVLIGMINDNPLKFDQDVHYGYIELVVQRPYMEVSGEYENDIFKVKLWRSDYERIASKWPFNTCVSIKGRLSTDENHNTIVIGETLGFL